MTYTEIDQSLRKYLLPLINELGVAFKEDNANRIEDRRNEEFTDFVDFGVLTVPRSREKYFCFTVSITRSFPCIQDIPRAYFLDRLDLVPALHRVTFGLDTGISSVEESVIPESLIVEKADKNLFKKGGEFCVDAYYKIRNQLDKDSNFATLDKIYNGGITPPYYPSFSEPVIRNAANGTWFNRLIIAYFAKNPNLEKVYEKNRIEILKEKARVQSRSKSVERTLEVYDDIYRRIQSGDIKRPDYLI